MLVLKGCGGKSHVLYALDKTCDCFSIVYDKDIYNYCYFGKYLVDTKECSISQFCDCLPELVRGELRDHCRECKDMIIVYTNLKEEDISEIKDVVSSLENQGYCRVGVVMCQE